MQRSDLLIPSCCEKRGAEQGVISALRERPGLCRFVLNLKVQLQEAGGGSAEWSGVEWSGKTLKS